MVVTQQDGNDPVRISYVQSAMHARPLSTTYAMAGTAENGTVSIPEPANQFKVPFER